MILLRNLFDLYLEAAPWLLLGLIMAGLLKAWLPEGMLTQKLGRGRFLPILKATLIGAPLPLCSCGVLPAAMGLRRSGASRSTTVAFMISTPETGPDSIAVTYALLGPFMAVARPVAAILSALFTGILNSMFIRQKETEKPAATLPVINRSECECGEGGCGPAPGRQAPEFWPRTRRGLRYAFVDILDDIWRWLFAGLILAALVMSYISADELVTWGDGILSMLLMLLVGIPMYICATASTPLAAAMILAGVSPGTVLVFLLAGPATNLATMGVIQQEMGSRTLLLYLLGIAISSVLLGLLTNQLIDAWQISIRIGDLANRSETAGWIAGASGLVLIYFAFMSFKRSWSGKVLSRSDRHY
jgi:uncharacterized protein